MTIPANWLRGLLILCCSATLLAQASPKTVQERLGYPASARLLLIHADDLGMSHSVNRATIEALEKGWITSASILVPCPWFPEAARWAKQHPDADLGIHQALNSEWTDLRWAPISGGGKVPSLVDDHGYLPLDTETVARNAKLPEVDAELHAQIDRAQQAGVHITHLDTHMGALVTTSDLLGLYRKMGEQYRLPILLERAGTHGPPALASVPPEAILIDRVVSMVPGVAAKDWLDWYKKELAPLSPGVYQIIVHLAYDDDEMRGATWDHPDWGAAWRQQDFEAMKNPDFHQFLKDQGFTLITWKELAKAIPGAPSTR